MKKQRISISSQLSATMILLVAGIFLIFWIVNGCFLEKYYLFNKKNELLDAFEIVNDENIVVMEADENDMTASAVPGLDETPITDTALDEGIIIENVHIVQEEDSEMTLINAEVNGYSALFADIDSDGVIDMMAVDVNDDSSLSDDEVFDLKGTGITVDDLCSAEIEDKFGDADDEDMFLA